MKLSVSRWLEISLPIIAISLGAAHANTKELTGAVQCALPGRDKLAPGRQPGGSGVASTAQSALSQPSTPSAKYVGPTPNITAVANGIGLRATSVMTEVAFKSGMVLSKPVAIALEYSSTTGQYRPPVQTYDICNGNKFLYDDRIVPPAKGRADSAPAKPRQMSIKVTLTQENPDGEPYVFTIPLKANLDPHLDLHYDSRSTIIGAADAGGR